MMVDYTIFIKTSEDTWEGFHYVKNADCVPRIGEYITFKREGATYDGKRIVEVNHPINFKKEQTSGELEIEVGTPGGINVYVEGTAESFINAINKLSHAKKKH